MSKMRGVWARFLPLLLASVAAQLALLLFSSLEWLAVFEIWRLACLPLAALLLPARAAYLGAPPMLAWLPQGLWYLALPPTCLMPALWGLSLLLFALSVLGACAGSELAKRKGKRS